MEHEEIIMKLIMHGGNARAKSMLSIEAARHGDFQKAMTLIAEADEEINQAHEVQTQLIQDEVRGEVIQISLLMIHAQDHLMNAMTVRDLSKEMIKLIERGNENV